MESRAKRIGMAVLRVIAENAIASIPIYGPYLKIGVEIINAAKNEIDKEQEQSITNQQIIDALRSLTYAEASQVVDTVLASPQGTLVTAKLPAAQREILRKQLINLPSEFEQILANIEQQEKQQARNDVIVKENEARIQSQLQQEEFNRLKQQLKTQLEAHDFQTAYRTASKMLVLKPNDSETLKVEAFITKRVPLPKEMWVTNVGLFVFNAMLALMAIGQVIATKWIAPQRTNWYISDVNPLETFFVYPLSCVIPVMLLGLFHFTFIPRIWRYLPLVLRRWVLPSITLFLFVIFLIICLPSLFD